MKKDEKSSIRGFRVSNYYYFLGVTSFLSLVMTNDAFIISTWSSPPLTNFKTYESGKSGHVLEFSNSPMKKEWTEVSIGRLHCFTNDDEHNNTKNQKSLQTQFLKAFTAFICSFFFLTPLSTELLQINENIPPADKVGSLPSIIQPQKVNALTDEQQLVADVWKRVDKLYLDREFNKENWFELRQKYIKKDYKTDNDVYESIKSMLSPLGDPYTRFLPPSQYQSLFSTATGSVAGIGVSLSSSVDTKTGNNLVEISDTEEVGPARESGIQIGDKLLEVDGKNAIGMTPDDVAVILRGPANTKIGMVVQHVNGQKEDYILVRKELKIKSVSSKLVQPDSSNTKYKYGNNIGYIRIKSFSKTTKDDVISNLLSLEKQNNGKKVDSVVLDVRSNPGGYLNAGIDVAKLFLHDGDRIVSVVGKTGIMESYTVDRERDAKIEFYDNNNQNVV